jgi:predicted Zn-dependent peptidase
MISLPLSLPRVSLGAAANPEPTVQRFANGLTVVAESMPVPSVNLSVWINAGSACEGDEINGMAHFLEHMTFKGTPNLACGEFEQRIESRGAIANAATSQDYTHYYITTAPDDFADLAPLQIDLVTNPRIPEVDFAQERPVILEEIRRSHDNPQRRLFQHSMELAFERLPYRRSVLGPAAVIEGLQVEQMRQFHRQHYHPDQITAVVVGNVDPDVAIAHVAESFDQSFAQTAERWADRPTDRPDPAQFPAAAIPDPCPHPPEPPHRAIARREIVDPQLQQARLTLVWRVPGAIDLGQTYPLDLLAAVLGRGRTSRLVRDLREERGLVTKIGVSNITYRSQGAFCISARLPVENLAIVEAEIVRHLQALQQAPPTPTERDRICTRVANGFIFGNETPNHRGSLYGYYQSQTGSLDAALRYPESVRAIDGDMLQRAAQTWLNPQAYGVVVAKPHP